MLDVVVESIMDASDEELAEDVRATGDDPSEVAQRMKGIVDAVMANRDLLFDRCRVCGFDEEQSRAMVDTAYRRSQEVGMVEVIENRRKRVQLDCPECESTLSYVPALTVKNGDVHWHRPLLRAYIVCPVCEAEIDVDDPDASEEVW